jgi:hypothetical protein
VCAQLVVILALPPRYRDQSRRAGAPRETGDRPGGVLQHFKLLKKEVAA